MSSSFIDTLLLKVTTSPIVTKKVRISRDDYISSISKNIWHFLYLKYWKFTNFNQRLRMLLGVSLTFLSVYVISPTVTYYFKSPEQRAKMFSSKRLDKYTTGLINTRNDCFANASIQAFASLPGLNLYLNEILKQYSVLTSLALNKNDENDPLPTLPLHQGLATILKQLQVPITTSKYISVWPFLQVIEKIFNSKISTNQNDAHELVQLILETLDNETTKFKKYIKKHNLNLSVPDLPFNGLVADQLTCLSCLNSSKPTFHPFSVLSLPVPEANTASLADMIKNSEVETISGYNCLRCKLRAILTVENDKIAEGVQLSEEEAQIISKLKIMEPNLTINDDLEEHLEKFIKNYSYKGFTSSSVISTIVKKTLLVRAPDLLTVHLSRSLFTANHIVRNGCKVEFDDILDIDIDENLASAYEEKLKEARRAKKMKNRGEPSILSDVQSSLHNGRNNGNFQPDGEEDDLDDDDPALDGYDEDRHEPVHLAKIHSKILASHEEQVEEPSHQEDVTNVTSDLEDWSRSDKVHSDSTDVTSLDNELEEDIDGESIHSVLSEDLNISKENAKYKLRGIIRHQGTHNAGHYECFRHKPLLVKDIRLDKVVNLTPVIQYDPEIEEQQQKGKVPEEPTPKISVTPPTSSSKNSSKKAPSPSPTPSNSGSVSRNSDVLDSPDGDETGGFSKFRSKLGSFVSRRSSGGQSTAQSRRASIAVVPNHALQNVTEDNSVTEITADLQNFELNQDSKTSKDKKYKKISSVAKYPYWRISDTIMSEVRKEDVLREKPGVYMIYYERIREH